MQAERLLSDDTSVQFKPRHAGGEARRGEVLQVGFRCITVMSTSHQGHRDDEAGNVETTPSTLSETCQGDSEGFVLSGGRNTC